MPVSIEGFLGQPPQVQKFVDKQLRFAGRESMNNALFHTWSYLKNDMDNHIKGGAVKYTKTGLWRTKATRQNLRAHLYFKRDRYYINHIIKGGQKPANYGQKSNAKYLIDIIWNDEHKAPITGKGNIFPSYLKKAETKPVPYKGGYLWGGYLKGRPRSDKYRGIWYRKGRDLQMVVSFARKSRKQKITYPADKMAEKEFYDHYNKNVGRNVARAMATGTGFGMKGRAG
jgi:hypothetical protein